MDNTEEVLIEQLVVFKLDEQNFAFNIASVHEIIRMEYITSVPRTPPFLKGVINLRGRIVPVIDLKKRFSLDRETEVTGETRIVIVDAEKDIVGVIVDAVTEVLSLSRSDIEPTPPAVEDVDAAFIRGVGKVDERLIMLLDEKNVFGVLEKSNIA
ncbi:MAG: chemotaxis protein CheW [Bacillota bacterium]|jgi:purine-binding chemotaxis protein CheW